MLGGWSAAQAVTPMAAAGGRTSCSVDSTGVLRCWGDDTYGQLGQGRLLESYAPLRVGIGNMTSPTQTAKPVIATGSVHNIALMSDGSLWAWGKNESGQLGDGTTTSSATPQKIGINFALVSAGSSHTIAIKRDGTLWAWGSNNFGQLGDGTTTASTIPKQIGTDFIAVAAGHVHSIGIKSDGSLWAWGKNEYGQLGNGTTANNSAPQKVGTDFVAAAAGGNHTIAIKSDGSLWTWGNNGYGQLGDGTTSGYYTPNPTPRKVGIGFTMVAAGSDHAVGIKSDGSLWTWGYNAEGQLGDGTTTNSPIPKQIGNGFSSIATGWFHTLALKNDGSLWTWGYNYYGQLGDGRKTGIRDANPNPKQIGTGFTSVAAGWQHSIAMQSDGTLWAWGDNRDGELGLDIVTNSSTPKQVGTGFATVAVAELNFFMRSSFAVAIKSDGSLWSWGGNHYGQLGDNTTADSSTPKQIGTGFSTVTAGDYHALAIKSDGSLWAWGNNDYGQLGDGTQTASYIPKQVGSDFVSVSAGRLHTIAIKKDGTLWAWGNNSSGQLGDGTNATSFIPKEVGIGFSAVAAGAYHTVAIKSDLSLWTWGANDSGQVGDGTTTTSTIPKHIGTAFISMAAGSNHTVAVKHDGSLWAWGANQAGQLGDGTRTTSANPKKIGTGFISVATAISHSLGLQSDGSLTAFGANESGQLGDATLAQRLSPVSVVNSSVDGLLNLQSNAPIVVPPSLRVPFFVSSTGNLSTTAATVATTAKFNPSDTGKSGGIFITATVPVGSALAQTAIATSAGSGPHPNKAASTTPTSGFTLIQLTPTGWKTVINGQLVPYVTGVLGDQIATQTLLNKVDTTSLKGAEFCVGYGINAQDMINNGNIRAVATVPGADATASCVVSGTLSVALGVLSGWNLLGNSVNQSIDVTQRFGDRSRIESVWKWDAVAAQWQFYTPTLDAVALETYTQSKGFRVLTTIAPGDGYWVNAIAAAELGTVSGAAIYLRKESLARGWNLVATASPITAREFNATLSATPVTTGQVPINVTSLWAWDAQKANWYFYAPSLDAIGGAALSDYIRSTQYLDFEGDNKTVGNAAGIWVYWP